MRDKIRFEDFEEIEQETFVAVDESGNEVEYEVIFAFDCEETGKSYIVYTDNTEDEDGSLALYASCYDPTGEDMQLLPVETDEEWEMLESVLEEIMENVKDDE